MANGHLERFLSGELVAWLLATCCQDVHAGF